MTEYLMFAENNPIATLIVALTSVSLAVSMVAIARAMSTHIKAQDRCCLNCKHKAKRRESEACSYCVRNGLILWEDHRG